MKALRVNDSRVRLAEIQMPGKIGEALVRVIKSGICNTDLEIARGYAGFNGTIGHEFVGVVENCEDAPDLVGKRVVGEINAGCGECALCMAGDPRHCPTRTVLGIHGRDGAHAEYLTLPSRNLISVPTDVSDESAVFAEPLAAAYGIAERVELGSSDYVFVVGDGKLGLLAAFCASLNSSRVVLVGRHREKLALAESRGIETISESEVGQFNKVADIVIEASGSETGFTTALDLVKPRGTIVLKSTFQGTSNWDVSRIVVNEISVVGSRCGRLAPAIELLASKKVKVDDLISKEFRLDDGVMALGQASEQGVLKVLLRP
ncbi:MAG: alcohol dehydrogenase catalytic domain-containing protein [Pyrinomonadaceae bacterium]